MWKQLTLLAAVAGTLVHAWRTWGPARTAATARRRARHDVQRWEGEGGSLHPAAARETAAAKAPATPSRPRVRASTGTTRRSKASPAASS